MSPSCLHPAAPLQVGHMSWGQRFEVTGYQAYDVGGWGAGGEVGWEAACSSCMLQLHGGGDAVFL